MNILMPFASAARRWREKKLFARIPERSLLTLYAAPLPAIRWFKFSGRKNGVDEDLAPEKASPSGANERIASTPSPSHRA